MNKDNKENKRVVCLSYRTQITPGHIDRMNGIEGDTASSTGMIWSVAVNYGDQQENTRAGGFAADKVARGELTPDQIDEELLESFLYTTGQPMPDFILRTSGEMRISNFLLWQSAYAEFIVTDVLWPDFKRSDFDAAVAEFYSRSRRFGGS